MGLGPSTEGCVGSLTDVFNVTSTRIRAHHRVEHPFRHPRCAQTITWHHHTHIHVTGNSITFFVSNASHSRRKRRFERLHMSTTGGPMARGGGGYLTGTGQGHRAATPSSWSHLISHTVLRRCPSAHRVSSRSLTCDTFFSKLNTRTPLFYGNHTAIAMRSLYGCHKKAVSLYSVSKKSGGY